MKDKGIDFLRLNMSHSSLQDLERTHNLARKMGIEYILDTEGSQIRTACMNSDSLFLKDGQLVEVHGAVDNIEEISSMSNDVHDIVGGKLADRFFYFNPAKALEDCLPGDVLYINSYGPVVQVIDISFISSGYIVGKVITAGELFDKKAIYIDRRFKSGGHLPILSEKDQEAVRYGLCENISHIAVSYVRSGADIDSVREVTENRMSIISKVENISALFNLDEIIEKSDFLLIDRGDMSKEIPSEKIPFIQQHILKRCRTSNKGVFVATNLLESMILNRKPTRAEVQDITNAVLDGAYGLTLSAETAVGQHPVQCMNTMDRVITHVESIKKTNENTVVRAMTNDFDLPSHYLVDHFTRLPIEPHGGKLVQVKDMDIDNADIEFMEKISIEDDLAKDVFQIAVGAFSPLCGFMNQDDLNSVLKNMKLSGGCIWPLPITLDVDKANSESIKTGENYCLIDSRSEPIATLRVEQVYENERRLTSEAIYGTFDPEHPGVKRVLSQKPFLVAGEITSVNSMASIMSAYDLTPRQLRKLFYEKGWEKIAGFHTRNVAHRGHEYILSQTIEEELCDGILLHPVVGSKKKGDFNSKYILRSYELLMNNYFPKDKFILATFNTYSRYAGPREAVFTALCRKNYGCTHFIVGRDHTGFSDHYDDKASRQLLDGIEDLGVEIISFNEVFYSEEEKTYFQSNNFDKNLDSKSRKRISGTEQRKYLSRCDLPPDWLTRREISMMLRDAISNGEPVFAE
jgi:ATP sulfurylase